MIWIPLDSEMLKAAAYDAQKQFVYLRFRKDGDVYRYFDFPAGEYQAFLEASAIATNTNGSPNSTPPDLRSRRLRPDGYDAAAGRGAEAEIIGVEAVELLRQAGADHKVRSRVI